MINIPLLQNVEVSAYNWLKSETKAVIFWPPTQLCWGAILKKICAQISVFKWKSVLATADSFPESSKKALQAAKPGKVGC
jgi:hypothetical protein